MTRFMLLWLTLIFVAPGCSATKDDILKALKRHETALCACKTEANCTKAVEQFNADPILMEVGVDFEMLQIRAANPLKTRIGDKSYTAFRKKLFACLGRGSDKARPSPE